MSADKTEKPSLTRIRKSREKGQFAVSRDFVSAFQWMTFVALLLMSGEAWLFNSALSARYLLERAFAAQDLTPRSLMGILGTAGSPHVAQFAMAAFALAVASLGAHMAVTQLGFSAARLVPDFNRLNPLSRLKQLPSQNWGELLRAILLLPIFGFVVHGAVMANVAGYLSLPFMPVRAGASQIGLSYKDLFVKSAAILFAYGAFDFFRQSAKHQRSLRMTKQEVRDEYKESEGNPQIKGRIRRIQRDLARRRMMQEVPTATAVIVNPEHYAVAIRYDLESMTAPKVVAKGKNYLALRIRRKGIEHGVPLVENAPLAQALYKTAEIGQEIPAQFYKAVAEILAYIYRIMNGKLPG